MKDFVEIESLFYEFPNQWFMIGTVKRYTKSSGTHIREALNAMVRIGTIQKKRDMKKHSQAIFYRLSAANRKRLQLQNHTQNRTISSGAVSAQ
jgi:DNA-binding transcriptional regulator PaaX